MNYVNGSSFWSFFVKVMYFVLLAITVHYCKTAVLHNFGGVRYKQHPNLEIVDTNDKQCKQLFYEISVLRKQVLDLRSELEALTAWKVNLHSFLETKMENILERFYSDHIGVLDYAAEYSGGSIMSTPETIPYPSRYSMLILGTFDWVLQSKPDVLLEPVSVPGKCFAFYGSIGRVRVKLGRPVVITHISLEHLRIGDYVNGAPKDFQVLGLKDSSVLEDLGSFVYDLKDGIIQTFKVSQKNYTFKSVELRILSNHGNDEFTCLYRFRVHSLIH